MKRKASAVWSGDLKTGKGKISTESGTLKETQYSFSTRFEHGIGTNPEELIAAAHAGCFSMAFSSELGKAGFKPDSIATTATVTLEMLPTGPTVTESHLEMTAKIQGFPESWMFMGGKTAAYRQVGNAFPPPVASAVAMEVRKCLEASAQLQLAV